MTRLATPRPPGEHLAVVARLYRQVGQDSVMEESRRAAVLQHLSAVQRIFEREIGDRPIQPELPDPERKARRAAKKRRRP